MTAPPDLADRVLAIRKKRALETAWAVFTTIGTVEVLFASFAFGASYGPGPLRPLELLLGLAASFALGAVLSMYIARRRIERGAKLILSVAEGRKTRRIVVFEDYVTIGPEIVMKAAITQAEVDPRGLVLRYRDPAYEGAVLRELGSDRVTLERLATALLPPPPLQPL